jgi:catechol 2,3-dioxygenase-like lactoylglutathione lyase family enzyme
MNLSFQAILANVTDIDRSADFYSEVFEFPVLSRDTEVVTMMVNRADRRQVLILRKAHSSQHPGGRSIGARVLGFEAASMEEVDLVEARLKERTAFAGRRRNDGWEAVIGYDPDRIPVSVAANPAGGPIKEEDWSSIDEIIYMIGG